MTGPIDYGAGAVEARLRAAAAASPLWWTTEPRVDRSPAAVEARLAACAELSRVCAELAQPTRATAAPDPGRLEP